MRVRDLLDAGLLLGRRQSGQVDVLQRRLHVRQDPHLGLHADAVEPHPQRVVPVHHVLHRLPQHVDPQRAPQPAELHHHEP
nr:hypothetical protein [Micromonospora sp. M42]